MNRRWSAFLVLVLGIALFAWSIHSWVSRAPTYQGKSARAWFAEYARTTNTRGKTASLNALRALGPDTVPVLLNAVQAKDTGLNRFELFIWTHLPAIIKSRLPGENRPLIERSQANLSFRLPFYFTGITSSQLSWKSVPQLAKDLKRPNREYRYVATLALRERGLAAREALPVLIESVNDPYYLVRMGVVKTLGQLGSEAKPAVHALVQLLEETSDDQLRRA